jgi:hypothetical protein
MVGPGYVRSIIDLQLSDGNFTGNVCSQGRAGQRASYATQECACSGHIRESPSGASALIYRSAHSDLGLAESRNL